MPEPTPAAPVAQVTPPPATPPAVTPPPVDAFDAAEPLPTMAPQLAPQADSFEWPALETEPAAKPPGRSRRPLVIGAGLIVLIGAGIAAAVSLTGGGSSGLSTVTSSSTSTPTQTTRTTATRPLLPDPAVPAARRPALIGAGNALFATSPGGRVVRLNSRSLRQLAIASDASRPRALAVLGRTLIVADDKTLYRLRSDTLAPVGASAFGPAPLVAGGGKSPIVAATGRRVCLVGASGPGPCVRASFVATGVGARPGGTVLAVDGPHGALATFRRAGKKLVASGSEIVVGKKAHGPVVVVGSRAYVPVSRGIAVVDLATRKVTSTIPLQVTPGAPAIVGGTIVAPLPARGGVALISSGAKAATPRFVATGPLAYAAGAGTGSLAYVANAGDGTITLVDVSKGKALRRLRISSLRGAAVPRAIVRRGSVKKVGNLVTLTLHLGSGALDRSGLLVRSRSIAHGTSVVELWQGGIASAIGRVAGQGVTATLRPSAGRVVVRLSAAAGAFTALAVGRANGGRDVVLLLTARPPATTGGGGSSTGGGAARPAVAAAAVVVARRRPRVAVAVVVGRWRRWWWRRRPRELLASGHPAAAGELLGVVRLVEARDLDDVAGVRRVQELLAAERTCRRGGRRRRAEEDEVARHEVGAVDRHRRRRSGGR